MITFANDVYLRWQFKTLSDGLAALSDLEHIQEQPRYKRDFIQGYGSRDTSIHQEMDVSPQNKTLPCFARFNIQIANDLEHILSWRDLEL